MLSWVTQTADRRIGMDDLTEPHFLRHPPGLTVGEIAALTGAELQDVTNHSQRMTNVAPIDLAEAGDLSFVDNAKFAKGLTSTRAGAVLISEHFQCLVPSGLVVLLTPEPYKCFVLVTRELYPDTLRPSSLFEIEGIASSASVHPSAQLASSVTVDPGALIGPRAKVGAGTLIGANSVIGPDVQIGQNCSIGPGSSITNTIIGDRVIIHPGCHIGQDGFGFIGGQLGISGTAARHCLQLNKMSRLSWNDHRSRRDSQYGYWSGNQDRQPPQMATTLLLDAIASSPVNPG
jgi:UDP-3-O-[3-hydroxymyristoyl] glucosamine N-acyltransferase